jgi:hypothetical protein
MEIDVLSILKDVGFPVAITLYLLIYFRKTIDGMRDVISKTNEIMTKICDKLNIEKGG